MWFNYSVTMINITFQLLDIYRRAQNIYSHVIYITTAHPWCGGHSISINVCGVWEVRAGVYIHVYIHVKSFVP